MMLSVRELNAWYGRHHVLRDVELDVAPGELVAVIGPNGAGKTSLMHALLGIDIARRGEITHDGARVEKLASHQLVKRGVSLIPTGRQLFPYMTVRENLQLGAYANGSDDGGEQLDRVVGYFPVLKERYKQLAGTLSGGEQQMLAIGRGLMARPTLLLIDEPSMGLAPKIIAAITGIITQLNEDGLSILLVEQNAALALKIAERVYVLENGRIAMSGKSDELTDSAQLRKSYLGI
jgi:branched-chain amino acid transport system ATP-binding protein